MYAPTLAALGARVHALCGALHSQPDDENRREELLSALAELIRTSPTGGSRPLVGQFNQATALGGIVQYHLAGLGRLTTPQVQQALKRSLVELMSSVDGLRLAVQEPAPWHLNAEAGTRRSALK